MVPSTARLSDAVRAALLLILTTFYRLFPRVEPEEVDVIATSIPTAANAYAHRSVTGRDLISIQDFMPQELACALELAAAMKARPADYRGTLVGKQIVLFFEKPSLRTRLTFEAGINSLGGVSFFVDQTQSRLGARESLSDVAHNLERWVDGLVLRTFAHETVTTMAMHASIPVINALSELEHPCQALADMLTLQEQFGNLRNVHLAYVGDGNNVAHSLLLAAAGLGTTISVGTPKGFEPNAEIVEAAQNWPRPAADMSKWSTIRLRQLPVLTRCIPMPGPVWGRSTRRPSAVRFLPHSR